MARLEAVLSANTRDFDRGMDKSESKLGIFAKTAGKAGALGAVVALGAAVKVGVGEFMEAQRVTAQTNAVLKSTGGVANVSAGQVDKLAGALMRKSGVDDEQIKSGANVLLTFTKIRNEAGRGNKVFDDATKATLNLSVALGKDMNSSAIMVGKALNDPIKGMASMGRAGVQFTAEQKSMVKQLIASGDTMGAQKIILAELETQFGGSAEAAGKTFGGQINIAKQTLSNLAGEGVGKVMPFLIQFVAWIRGSAVPWVKGLVAQIRGGEGGGSGLQGAFASVAAFIRDVWWPTAKSVFNMVKEAFVAIVAKLREKEPEIRTIMSGVQSLFRGISVVLREVVIPALKYVFTEILPPIIGGAITVIAGVVTGIRKIVGAFKDVLGWVQKHWGTISSIIEKSPMVLAFKGMKEAIEAIVDGIKWLIDNVKTIPKIPGFGSSAADVGFPPKGDAHDPRKGIGFNLMGASPVMAPFAAAAAGYGLQVTSGFRPGAITANGTPSDHGAGKAIDVSGSTASMGAYFKSLIGNRGVKQAFFDPLGSIFSGAWNSYREGGHSKHVHVATFDQGGILKPGWTAAYNGTGQNEYVSRGGGQPILVNLVLDGVVAARALFDPLKNENTRRGRLGGGFA